MRDVSQEGITHTKMKSLFHTVSFSFILHICRYTFLLVLKTIAVSRANGPWSPDCFWQQLVLKDKLQKLGELKSSLPPPTLSVLPAIVNLGARGYTLPVLLIATTVANFHKQILFWSLLYPMAVCQKIGTCFVQTFFIRICGTFLRFWRFLRFWILLAVAVSRSIFYWFEMLLSISLLIPWWLCYGDYVRERVAVCQCLFLFLMLNSAA